MKKILIVYVVVAFIAMILAQEAVNKNGASPASNPGEATTQVVPHSHIRERKDVESESKDCNTPLGKLAAGEERLQGCQKTYCCKNGEYKVFACDQSQPDCKANPDACCK